MRLLLPALLAACGGPAEPEPGHELPRCHIEGVSAEARCGTLTVFEDREANAGRTIDLRVVVIPAVRPDPEPDPVFFLAGGPGQAASEVIPAVLPTFQRVQQGRDLVFVDQRGTGASHPLDCEEDVDPSLVTQFTVEPDLEEVTTCRDTLSADADLTRYTTPLAMDDLDDVREWLGYERINLYGASYGTRAGLVYARRHPDRVRTLILDGNAPPEMRLFLHFAEDAQAAMDALVADCAADTEGCGAAFPDLATELASLWARPAEGAEGAEPVAVDHPRTGAPEVLPIEGRALAAAMRGVLYQPQLASLLPRAVHEAAQDRWEPLIALTTSMSSGTSGSMSMGMMLSVACAEDWPRITAEDRAAAAEGTFVGDTLVETLEAWCGIWPRATLAEGYSDPVVFGGPTLLLSGTLDPVTPPRWGERVGATLSDHVHIVAPGAGHNVAPLGCVPRMMDSFIEAGTTDGVDPACAKDIVRPGFFVDFAGPEQ
jgi:pimeloyl-ACP methyl ester carboxylesterase